MPKHIEPLPWLKEKMTDASRDALHCRNPVETSDAMRSSLANMYTFLVPMQPIWLSNLNMRLNCQATDVKRQQKHRFYDLQTIAIYLDKARDINQGHIRAIWNFIEYNS